MDTDPIHIIPRGPARTVAIIAGSIGGVALCVALLLGGIEGFAGKGVIGWPLVATAAGVGVALLLAAGMYIRTSRVALFLVEQDGHPAVWLGKAGSRATLVGPFDVEHGVNVMKLPAQPGLKNELANVRVDLYNTAGELQFSLLEQVVPRLAPDWPPIEALYGTPEHGAWVTLRAGAAEQLLDHLTP